MLTVGLFFVMQVGVCAGTVQESISQNTLEETVGKTWSGDRADEEPVPEMGDILYRGIEGDIEWSIDTTGHLSVIGTGDYSRYSSSDRAGWLTYAQDIQTATVQVKGITNTAAMFSGCSNLKNVDLSGLDTRMVTSMAGMFSGCSQLESLDVSHFDTSIVTDMSAMFSGCSSLKELYLNHFDTGCVLSMSYMFSECTNLEGLYISEFDTANVLSMAGMFSNCNSLRTLEINDFNTVRVENMNAMFDGCSNLESLDVSKFDTGSVKELGMMFHGCSKLSSLNVGNFNTERVVSLNGIFSGCTALKVIDLSNWDASGVTEARSIFEYCDNLLEVYAPKNLHEEVELPDSYKGKSGRRYWYDDTGNMHTVLRMDEASAVHYSRKLQWIREDTVELFLQSSYFCVGKAVKPEPYVTYMHSIKLELGKDYKVSYQNNRKAGKGTLVVTGIGNYTGSVSQSFSIVDSLGDLSGCSMKLVSAGAGNGNSMVLGIQCITPAKNYVVELSDAGGKKIKNISYSFSGNRSLYTRTIKNLTKDVYGIRIRPGIGKTYGKWSDRVYVIRQPDASATALKGSAKIKWEKLDDVSGYEIYMSRRKNGKFTKVATTDKNVTEKTISKLGGKKLVKGNYYYYVLGKKKVGKKTFRSAVNEIGKIKVK